jgi:hypothetical protein
MSEVNNDKVETLLQEIKEQIDTETKTSEIIAKSADSMVAAQIEKFDSLSKAVDEISSKLANLVEAFSAISIPTKEDLDSHIEEKASEIAKSLNEKVEEIEKTVEANTEEKEILKKQIEVLENEPVVKSASVEIDEPETFAKTVEEVVNTPSRQEVIEKALSEIVTAVPKRQRQLFRAISQLEAGASLDSIKL